MASCTVNYNLKDAGYANFANQTLTFTLLTAGAEGAGDYIVAASSVTSTSDTNGDGSVTLFVNDDSGIKSIYEVTLPSSEHIKFIIPTGTSTIELANLIVNNQPVGDSESQQSSVYAQAIQRANHTGTQLLSTVSDAGTIASQNSNAVSITGGSVTGITDISIADGGTGSSTASGARTNLSAQQQGDVLDDFNTLGVPTSDGEFIVATGAGAFSYESGSTARTSLGLGTIATQASNSVDIDGGAIDGAVIGANSAAAGTFAAVTGTNILASATLGYTTGNGGTVTQGTSKTTGVTLNKISGEIVMNNAALADDATAAFTLTNSTIAATDVVIVNVASVGTAGAYQVTVGAVAAGSCSISVLNVSGGSLSEAIKLNFAVIKAVAS